MGRLRGVPGKCVTLQVKSLIGVDPMARFMRPAAASLAALALVFGAACSSTSIHGTPVNTTTAPSSGNTSAQAVATAAPVRTQTGKEMSTADLVKYAEASVVRVETTLATGTGVGTGFIADTDGNIVTNQHVIDGARARGSSSGITVTTSDGATYQAKVVGSDTKSDLAVIKIDAKNLTPLPIGNLENVVVGQDVVAIGYALDLTGGEGPSYSVTKGIVSAKNRSITESSAVLGAIQTDAAINHGNSGGPLLDMFGNVIGVNTAIAPDDTTGGIAPGIGFAVGANTVKAVYEQIKQDGKVNRGFLGIANFEALRPAKAKDLGIPDGTKGVYLPTTTQSIRTTNGTQTLTSVSAGGPADKAGLKPGDVITKIGDTTISDESELAVALIKHHPDEKVTMEIYRDGKKMSLDVTLGTNPNA